MVNLSKLLWIKVFFQFVLEFTYIQFPVDLNTMRRGKSDIMQFEVEWQLIRVFRMFVSLFSNCWNAMIIILNNELFLFYCQ